MSVTESFTSPAIAVPVGGVTLAAGLVSSLPVIINVIVCVYFLLMVTHKAYQMWKEWRIDHPSKGRRASSK